MGRSYKSELVGVFGHPVAENPTIVMLEAAFKELNMDWRYLTIEVLPDDLKEAVAGMRAMQMKGINLTIPHKIEVMKYLDNIAPDAALIGAVNTVRKENGKLIGENTDGKGFLESLRKDAELDPAGKNYLIIGAGGAARAITVELALAGAKTITVTNRTASKGEELVNHLNTNTEVHAEFLPWEGSLAVPVSTDVLVNATSMGLYPAVDDKPELDYSSINKNMVVCDVIPNPPSTAFLKEAAEQGAETLDGLGMLAYQGALGFKMWTGFNAPVAIMKDVLSREFME
ncbi:MULTISPECIES: shikimate dehydrogenase [unclassified Oceanispirochaeta]|uniref:shikimate dehydrogenase n=1 Tax=unclassified Oceanispirochaeta TaxID=2635722 RepID=UPI000E09C481|nr:MULTISPECIES: shikimate dehydrogenase [unclassified Oceanispirochaeta]MBF9015830.1 shikimate dehydrogenase [Oceanispirochaeta sp. M2]NPD72293.1 shikimate dehydrogenase [Oceanispirochaeta sp. M1]RDG32386.1 shikimate dehydrogenase [Oceanispirochaeta sp. M1]